MKISLNWLRELAPFELTAAEAVELGSRLGLEIAEVEERYAGFEQFLVGKIILVEPHPNADKLRLVTVDLGEKEGKVRLVCGAPNARENLRVAVALVGTTLPGGPVLKKAKIRGVESPGMVLSRTELGLEEKSSGVWELPATAVPGSTLRDLVGPADSILTFELTPNRADALSHLGIARDFAAALALPLTPPSASAETVAAVKNEKRAEEYARVDIEDPDLCSRYAAMIIEDVTVGPSPFWMQERLLSVGMRPISNVVDVTNYLLIEMGHPMHAFDLSLLKGARIIVRRAKAGETIQTLDGGERKLDPEMLVIADGKRPVAVAGVMGGANSEVNAKTRTVLLESAHFLPASVRRTARALGLNTEASYRFERGTDIEGLERAMRRCARLIAEVTGGRVILGALDVYPHKREENVISLRPERVRSIMGYSLKDERMSAHLEALGFGVTKKDEAAFQISVPSFRVDISREIDLVEEVGRLEGYQAIPSRLPVSIGAQRTPRIHEFTRSLRHVMAGLGFSECNTYPFESTPLAENTLSTGGKEGGESETLLRVVNPISAEEPFLRTSLIPSLGRVLRHNLNHGQKGVRLFEVGRRFVRRGDERNEEPLLGFVLSAEEEPSLDSRPNDFRTLRGIAEALLQRLGWDADEFSIRPGDFPLFRRGECAVLEKEGRCVGVIGGLSETLKRQLDLEGEAYGAELWIDPLLTSERCVPVYRPLPRFPASRRDLAVMADETVSWETVEQTVRATGGDLLEDVTLFDVYGGKGAKGIEAGKRSLAFRLTFRAFDRTLTVDEVEQIQEKVIKSLAERHGAELRGA